MKVTRAEALETARAALRRTMTPFGPAALAAIEAPACAAAVQRYVTVSWELQDAVDGFGGTDEDAAAIEQAAAGYRAALRAVSELVARVMMETVIPAGSTH